MKKLKAFQPSLINSLFHIPPEQINFGQCFVWAYSASIIFADVIICDTYEHAFIKYKSKFYDSECLSGAKDYNKLTACKFELDSTAYYDIEVFKKNWSHNLEKYDTSWNEIEKKSLMIIKKNYEKSSKNVGNGSSVCQVR